MLERTKEKHPAKSGAGKKKKYIFLNNQSIPRKEILELVI